MIVQKFGGTSMGSAQSIVGNVSAIVRRTVDVGERTVVVVSAMSGVTTQLLSVANTAAAHESFDTSALEEIKRRHFSVTSHPDMLPNMRAHAEAFVTAELEKLSGLLSAIAVIGELSSRTEDAVMGVGERLSAHLLTALLESQDCPAEYIETDRLVPSALRYESDAYWDELEKLFAARLAEVPSNRVAVVPGFFGSVAGGMLKAVGRGYSDYTAALVGSALGASEIQIWTDVDGVLTANPKIVSGASLLPDISYDEMAELAHFGAKVLHPFSVRPAVKSNIPMRILNTFNNEHPGTKVTVAQATIGRAVKSITYKKGITVVRLTTPRMLMTHGFLAKLGKILERHETSIDLIATSEVSISFTIEDAVTAESPVCRALEEIGDVTLAPGQAILSLVGSEIADHAELGSSALSALQANTIAVSMISFGDAKINFSVVVADADCERAVAALHAELCMP
jgi:aspartate kinase